MKRFLILWSLLLLYLFYAPQQTAISLTLPLKIERKNKLMIYQGDDAIHNKRLKERLQYACDAVYDQKALQSFHDTLLFSFFLGEKRFDVYAYHAISQRYPIKHQNRIYFCRAELINAFYLLDA